jgi:hypothetical protein
MRGIGSTPKRATAWSLRSFHLPEVRLFCERAYSRLERFAAILVPSQIPLLADGGGDGGGGSGDGGIKGPQRE